MDKVDGWIGVDPGVTEGYTTLITADGHCFGFSHRVHDYSARAGIMRQWKLRYNIIRASVENVGMRPGQGRSSNAKLVSDRQLMRGIIIGIGIDLHDVTPLKWQQMFGLAGSHAPARATESQRYRAKKKACLNFARRTFKEKKMPAAKADSLLIALYSRRDYESKLPRSFE